MRFKIRSFLIVLALMFSSGEALYASSLEDLYDRPDRPSMLEVLPFIHKIKEEPGIPASAEDVKEYFDQRVNFQTWLKTLLDSTPRLIAVAEKLHPGATWVFLGRDSLAISDVFEAYYHAIGQKNRVIRLGVSKGTFSVKSEDEIVDSKDWGHSVRSFFENEGFGWQNTYASKKKPFIIIDAISGGYGRQGRAILASMYASGLSDGESMLTMSDRLNFLGLKVSTFKHYPIYDVSLADQQLQREKWIWLLSNKLSFKEIFDRKAVLTYDAVLNKANEAGYVHFIGAWHDSFGPFVRGRNGIRARPGKPFPIEMRKSVLWTQKKIWQAMDGRYFISRVQQESHQIDAVVKSLNKPLSIENAVKIESLIKEKSKINDPSVDLAGALRLRIKSDGEVLQHQLFTFFNDHNPSKQMFEQLLELILQDGPIKNNKNQYRGQPGSPVAMPVEQPIAGFNEAFFQLLNQSEFRQEQVRKDSALEVLIKIHQLLKNSICDDILKTF